MALQSPKTLRFVAAFTTLCLVLPTPATEAQSKSSTAASTSSTKSSAEQSTSSSASSTKPHRPSATKEPRETQASASKEVERPDTGTMFDDAPVLTEVVYDSQALQLSYYDIADDEYLGTVTDRFQRPALSLSKLFLAQYVFENGTDNEADLAEDMLETSNDVTADYLYNRYPKAIDQVAADFSLESTTTNGERWGYSLTSTYDVVYFIYQLLREDPDSRVLRAMRNQAKISADGTKQNYGTSQLPGVQGSKFGWADDYSLHSSVSFGDDWIAAVAVTGSASDATEYAEYQLHDRVEQLEASS